MPALSCHPAAIMTSVAAGQANPLLGTWKLRSYETELPSGETVTPYGEAPVGYLSYAADGRVQVVVAARGRTAPQTAIVTEAESAALFATMFAYAGTYSIGPGKVTHHVDTSWIESWTGTQVRLFDLECERLVIRSHAVHPPTGLKAQYVLVWEKVKSVPFGTA